MERDQERINIHVFEWFTCHQGNGRHAHQGSKTVFIITVNSAVLCLLDVKLEKTLDIQVVFVDISWLLIVTAPL